MVETIAPAVCGSRPRTALALLMFAAGAIGVAAAVGLALGSLGSSRLLPVAIALAIAGVLREAGLIRLPLPQWRRQVPESWHQVLPLPLWSLGYGAGLGAGVLTYQPVATFLVVAVAAAASGTTAAVLALTAFAAGRVLGAALPPAFVDRMAGLYRPMRRANAVALAMLALALVAAPAGAAALPLGPGSQLDPSVADDGGLAYTQRADNGATTVVVRPVGGAPIAFPGASEPSLRGDYLAYHDAGGITVVKWRTRQIVLRLAGAWSKPAVQYPFLAAVLTTDVRRRMISVDLRTGRRQFLDVLKNGDDLGRPSIDRHLVTWHKTTRSSSRILIGNVHTGNVRIFKLSRTLLLTNPSLRTGTMLWIEQSLGISRVRERRLASHRRPRIRARTGSPRLFWTTAIGGGWVYFTRWNTNTGRAFIDRLPR
jgi:hypothetical protein